MTQVVVWSLHWWKVGGWDDSSGGGGGGTVSSQLSTCTATGEVH